MIPIKSSSEISAIKKACTTAAIVLTELKKQIRPGITTYDLDQIAKDIMQAHGAKSACYGYQLESRRFPGYTCLSVNEEVVHGIASMRKILKDGDIISLDVVVEQGGYIGDNAITVPVGAISRELEQLLQITKEALAKGIAQARVGNRIGDVSHAIQSHCEQHGYGVVRDLVGHGVGINMHEEPQIPNFGKRGTGPKIRSGMTLAIEPMVNLGTYKTKCLSDGWTIVTVDSLPSAHFEHTILTTDEGPEVLTIDPR